MDFSHVPVLLNECLEALAIGPSSVIADGTVGGAGHSAEILKRLGPQGLLLCTDRDAEALKAAGARLTETAEELKEKQGWAPAFRLIKSNYADLPTVLREQNIPSPDGILLDLGVSSYQLDNPDRGFSYIRESAPLDMRMDTEEAFTAKELLNTYSEAELTRILRDYGEERFASFIARRIVAEREKAPLETTGDLVRIVEKSIPLKYRKTGGHPAKRTFQAVRIELNKELTLLEQCIGELIDCLGPGGRMAVITFHSLEDRIVKTAFKTAENPCICPPDFPVCVCGRKSKGRVLSHKPILPAEEELERNSRSASAKLRVFVKDV